MTRCDIIAKPSGLYDVIVHLPDGSTTVTDMTPGRMNRLVQIIKEYNAETERQRAMEQHEKAPH